MFADLPSASTVGRCGSARFPARSHGFCAAGRWESATATSAGALADGCWLMLVVSAGQEHGDNDLLERATGARDGAAHVAGRVVDGQLCSRDRGAVWSSRSSR